MIPDSGPVNILCLPCHSPTDIIGLVRKACVIIWVLMGAERGGPRTRDQRSEKFRSNPAADPEINR